MNPTLTSLVNDVFTLTNRPDLVGETTLAVRNATLKAHQSDYFYKDIFETGIVFDFPATQQNLEYRTLIPRWRALKYIRKYHLAVSGDEGAAGEFLKVLTTEELVDSYGVTKTDVCYAAGLELKIRASAAHQHYLLGCYVNPEVAQDKYDSWIAVEQPAAIIYEAVAVVFKTVGYDEQANHYRQMAAEEYKALKATNIIAVGY